MSSPRVRRRARARASRSATRARWTRSRPGCCWSLVGRATRVQRFLMALPKRYETVARLGCTSTTGDPEGEIAPGRMPRRAAHAADRPHHASARRPTRRSRSAASAPTRWRGRARRSRCPSARSTVTRFELRVARGRARGVRDRVLVGHLRALADRRPRRRVLRRAAAHAASAPSTSPTPTRSGSSALDDALGFLPGGRARPARPPARRPTA